MQCREDVLLRLAGPADVPAIAEIHLEGWHSAHHDTPLRNHLDVHPAVQREGIWTKVLTEHPEGSRLWVVEAEGMLVAFIGTGPMRKPHRRADGVFELYALYQRKAVAGRGLARRLLDHAIADLRQRSANCVCLSSLASNRRAREFYERAGWRHIEDEVTDYQGVPLHHVVYRYDL